MKKILFIGLILLFVTGCGASKEEKVEKEVNAVEKQMTTFATNFYEKNVKNYINGITEQKVTIQQLKDFDYDTSLLVEPGKKTLCSTESYALIKIEDSTNVKKSKYTVENHLICGDYKTEN